MLAMSRRQTIGLFAATLAAPSGAATQSAGDRLRALLDASAAADVALDPLGEPGRTRPAGGPVFVDPLGDAYARSLETNKRRDAAELARIDRAALGPVDRVAYDVLAYKTRQMLDLFDNGLFAIQRQAPLNPSFGLHIELPDFVAGAGAPFETAADYDAGLERLQGFAGHLETLVLRLREGLAAGRVQPRIIVDNVLKQADAILTLPVESTPFYAAIRKLPANLPPEARARYAKAYAEVITTRVLPGYALLKTFLLRDYRPGATAAPGRWAMNDGSRLYAAELAEHTTTTMTAEAIHALGVSEVARIRAEMAQVRSRVGFAGDLKSLFEHVRTNPRFYCKTEAEILQRFAEIEARIWPAIPRLFHDRPRAPFRVAGLPALGEQRGTGYYKPGPADGVTPGTLYFNMAMLPTRPIPTLETLTLHEGIPGHHFQITLARENSRLPPLLRYASSTAYSEGWGLYAESLGTELGMFTDAWQWFGHLDMEMLRAVRLVVDTGIHALQWSRDRAIAYMLENTSMAPPDVAVEIDRYIAYPGQACAYKIGELTFARLQREARTSLGKAFDIREYHRQCLDTGALPMAVLERKIADWLARGGGPG